MSETATVCRKCEGPRVYVCDFYKGQGDGPHTCSELIDCKEHEIRGLRLETERLIANGRILSESNATLQTQLADTNRKLSILRVENAKLLQGQERGESQGYACKTAGAYTSCFEGGIPGGTTFDPSAIAANLDQKPAPPLFASNDEQLSWDIYRRVGVGETDQTAMVVARQRVAFWRTHYPEAK